MVTQAFVPPGFVPPEPPSMDLFVLEPLGPQHNTSDHAAWTSSVSFIRGLPGYPDGDWPPLDGMSLSDNLRDLERHTRDFDERRGFTYTVLDPANRDVIGCVYLYPSRDEGFDVEVQSWVREDFASLDGRLADAVATWIDEHWPWRSPQRFGR